MRERAPTASAGPGAVELANNQSLREIELAAALRPADRRLWGAALIQLIQGKAADHEPGAIATTNGARPLSVAVVTPYLGEDLDVLRRCHASVMAQSYRCRHIMVADGSPRREIEAWSVEHICLPQRSADYGDTPRAVGGQRAIELGCEAIAYLDADNTFRPHHVQSLVSRWQSTGADVVFSGRTLHFPSGQMLPALHPDDSHSHIDTSCMCFAGDLRSMASVWTQYPRPLSVMDDRVVCRMLWARGLKFACSGALTVRYTVHYASMYRSLNLPVPADARAELDLSTAAAYCRELSPAEWEAIDARLGKPVGDWLRNLSNWPHHAR